MKIKTFKLTYDSGCDKWATVDKDSICNHGLRKFFTIPIGLTKLWIKIHTTPAPGRVKFQVDNYGEITYRGIDVDTTVDDVLEKLCPKQNIYVEVIYKIEYNCPTKDVSV